MGILEGLLGIAAIVIALRAKPLGDWPYHWGVYIGATTGIAVISAFSSVLSTYGPMAAAIFVLVSAIACLGLLLRKKFGVLALGSLYVLSLIRGLQVLFAHTALSGKSIAVAFGFGVLVIANAIYFKNRWELLA